MKHDDIRHMLSEYIDGAVKPKQKAVIESHLKSCAECRNALAELNKTIEYIKKVEEVDSPGWMTQKIMAKVRAEAQQKRSFFHRLFYPLASKLPIQAVAVLFLAVTVFYIYQNVNPTEKYAEAPAFIEAKKEPPAAGTSMNEQKMKRDSLPAAKQAPQAPGYKSPDMKYMYEKPAVPSPAERKPSSAPVEERDIMKDKDLSARAKKPEALSPYAGAVAKDEARSEAPPSAAKAKAMSVGEIKEAGISLSVIVKDTNTAGKEVEKAVARLNGRIIKTESFENKKSVIIRLSASQFNELVRKLKQLGEIKEKGLASPAQAGDVDINVELLKSQMQK